jgi:hypothetical protein
VTRIVDRGAVTAAYVGIGMAVVIAISFLLVIPIEPVLWYLALPAGLLIGYYANQRSDRRAGPWARIVVNGIFAGLVTGLALAVLLLATKALFFAADNGYRDASAGGSLRCQSGADCVYQRYLADGRGNDLAGQGVTDASSFGRFYWGQQLATAGLLVGLTTAGGLGGAALYGVFRPRPGPGQAIPSAG